MDTKNKSLIGIGASIPANCQGCVEYHLNKARENGATDDEIKIAIKIGQMVRKSVNSQMDYLLNQVASGKVQQVNTCCFTEATKRNNKGLSRTNLVKGLK